MLNNKTVAVVVPAYNEEKQIRQVLEAMPGFVDRIIVVNDCSEDATAAIALEYINKNNSANPITNKQQVPNSPENKYNRAEHVLTQRRQADLKFFHASQIVNARPESDRVILINNLKNCGVGAAIARGYKWCRDNNIDCTAVMAGDAQMDPAELESICLPVINEGVDYVKGNRLIHGSARLVIPKSRYIGNSILARIRYANRLHGYFAFRPGRDQAS